MVEAGRNERNEQVSVTNMRRVYVQSTRRPERCRMSNKQGGVSEVAYREIGRSQSNHSEI
jgi:hypothetical protein